MIREDEMRIELSERKLLCNHLPKAFSGVRILQISDLHNRCFGKGQSYLLEVSKRTRPDYIFITGDLIDEHHKRIDGVIRYIDGAVGIAPIFYVSGNHEWVAEGQYIKLLRHMRRIGVSVLRDEIMEIERGGDKIQLIGMDDPYKLRGKRNQKYDRVTSEDFLKRFVHANRNRKKMFTILLSHRPEFLHFYAKAGIDLVYAGHAHGGMIRIPKVGGVLAPHQGFFPQYMEGVIMENHTTMVVSRGLGDGIVPFRINNRPEVVVTVLK